MSQRITKMIVAIASRLYFWDDEEEGSFELLLELFKENNLDVQELITLVALVLLYAPL